MVKFSEFIAAQERETNKDSKETDEDLFKKWFDKNSDDMNIFSAVLTRYIDKRIPRNDPTVKADTEDKTICFHIYLSNHSSMLLSDTKEMIIDAFSIKTCGLYHHVDAIVDRTCEALSSNIEEKIVWQERFTGRPRR